MYVYREPTRGESPGNNAGLPFDHADPPSPRLSLVKGRAACCAHSNIFYDTSVGNLPRNEGSIPNVVRCAPKHQLHSSPQPADKKGLSAIWEPERERENKTTRRYGTEWKPSVRSPLPARHPSSIGRRSGRSGGGNDPYNANTPPPPPPRPSCTAHRTSHTCILHD